MVEGFKEYLNALVFVAICVGIFFFWYSGGLSIEFDALPSENSHDNNSQRWTLTSLLYKKGSLFVTNRTICPSNDVTDDEI